ncbi:hypothetical protein GCM10007423_39310 [Dyadobacter endophyticus]|uniref:Lipocalin-like domain-containing protein n=1 Tax=Dyadobacter endophyticus TaxID=1749036 RepID=A0ABQ1YZE1_9BACT|nr:hypothetical protein [Dyadobacter endophyticus]GGH42587.1 hypothetical protein GCM10007423_39310 [Dyadobacter endophyticus]
MKNVIWLILLVIPLFISCERQKGFDAAGPISSYLSGKWQLEKIVSPTQTKIGEQIGYAEILESGNDQEDDYDRIFKDGKLDTTYIWSRNPGTDSDAKKMTVLVNYEGGIKRFYKIYRQLGKPTTLEASSYLSEVGGAADTVKYYYVQLP